MKRFCLFICLFIAALPFSWAQSASGASGEVVRTVSDSALLQQSMVSQQVLGDSMTSNNMPNRGISIPDTINDLIYENKISEARQLFDAFIEAQPKSAAFDVLFCSVTFYRQLYGRDSQEAVYREKVQEYIATMKKKYPKNADTYMVQIDETSTPEDIVELTGKALECEPEYMDARLMRVTALDMVGRMKEACSELQYLPESVRSQMHLNWKCSQPDPFGE